MTENNAGVKEGLTPKEFFESEWYKDGIKQLCADGWPTFVVPVNIKIRELLEQNQDLAEQIKVNLAGQERELKFMHEVEKLRAENGRLKRALIKISEGCPTKYKTCQCLENTALIALAGHDEQALRGADETNT